MKFRPTFLLHDINGKNITMDREGKINATLGDIAIQALLGELPGEQVPAEKKMHRFNTASRIKHALSEKAQEIDLPSEDITLIKNCIGKVYGPAVMGPAWNAIEG
jgi:hypothetical protein